MWVVRSDVQLRVSRNGSAPDPGNDAARPCDVTPRRLLEQPEQLHRQPLSSRPPPGRLSGSQMGPRAVLVIFDAPPTRSSAASTAMGAIVSADRSRSRKRRSIASLRPSCGPTTAGQGPASRSKKGLVSFQIRAPSSVRAPARALAGSAGSRLALPKLPQHMTGATRLHAPLQPSGPPEPAVVAQDPTPPAAVTDAEMAEGTAASSAGGGWSTTVHDGPRWWPSTGCSSDGCRPTRYCLDCLSAVDSSSEQLFRGGTGSSLLNRMTIPDDGSRALQVIGPALATTQSRRARDS